MLSASSAKAGQAVPATIAGVVVDARTSQPLPGVLVFDPQSSVFVETDGNGRFRLEVAGGRHTVAASLVGYALVQEVLEVAAGEAAEVTIRLPEGAGAFTDQVTVRGRAPVGADAAPAGASLLGRELQTVRGVMFDDPLRAVQALPSAAATDDFYSELSVRGSGFRHIGLALDGMPARYLTHTVQTLTDAGSTLMVNSDALGEVTLLPGSYPQRLGRHLGAQIDLATREGSRDEVRARAGLTGTSATILAEGPIGDRRGSWLASARRSYLDYLVKRLDEDAFSFGFSDAQAKLVYDLTPHHQVQWLALAGRSRFEQPTDELGANDVARAISASWLSGAAWRYTPSPQFALTDRVFVTGLDFANADKDGSMLDTGRRLDLGWRVDGALAPDRRWMFEFGADAIRLTGSREQRRRLDGAADPAVVGRYDSMAHAASVYGQATTSPASALTLTAGVRGDYWALTHRRAASPWVTVELAAAPHTRLRGGFGIYRQFPDLDQVYGIRGGGASLRDERATHGDAGVAHAIGRDTTLQLSWFTRAERDVLWTPGAEPRRLDDGTVLLGRGDARWVNGLAGRARGVELVVRRSAPAGLSGWVGYAYGRLRYTDRTSGEQFWADADQRHALTIFANLRASNRTNFSSKFRYGSNYPLTGYIARQQPPAGAPALLGGAVPLFLSLATERNGLRLPAYARLDLRADRTFNWSPRRLTLFVEVMNALNRSNVRNVPYGIDRSGRVTGATDSLMPILPSAGLVVEF